jgi:hypothetical protein
MKPIKQIYLHIPDKQHGDCWRACLASILECDIDTFPYHNGDIAWADEWDEVMNILVLLGYYYSTVPVGLAHQGILDCPDTDGYSIAIGKSNRGVNHAVVWKNGMAHDPHPENTGLIEITRFEILTKISYQPQP